ncbi:MAG: zincin-like metallopeptidase domain-containing protein [Dehalococcoidia bacterium]|nr:zincin-like metallopeptidase domain-containing protein [Dehalococcoidia bacterium]
MTDKHPLDNEGYSPISVEGRKLVNKETAQEALASVFGKLRSNALQDATIQYRGIEFTLERHTGWIGFSSETGNLSSYTDNDLFSSSGFIQRMANYVNRLPALVDETKTRIVQATSDAESMRGQTKQNFQQASELEAARESHKAVQRALLVKGPDVPEDQKSAVAKGIAEQKALLEKLGFSTELREFFSESNSYSIGDVESRLPETDIPAEMESRGNNYGLLINSQENSMNKKPYHEVVAEKLIEQLQQGTAPWQRPWQPGNVGSNIPMNPTTGKRYRGINAIHLMSEGRTDQRWLTYKQAAAAGGQVFKGEKGTPIQYWKFTEEQPLTDSNGKPVLNDQGEKLTLSVKLERPRVFFATVFNAAQIEGLPPLQPRKEQEWNAIERAEHILQASGVVIRHSEHNRAFYRPSTDSIHLPDKSQFHSADNYYATALHELGHWTGHEDRLNRDLVHPFGSEGYAKEELRAEIASMILGDELGIGHDPSQHAAYVGSWIKALKDDPMEIFRAAADAEKIQDYVLALAQTHIQEQSAVQAENQSVVVSTNQETNMQLPSNIAAQDNLTAYQVELARLLKLSTLTPGNYVPSEAAKTDNHAAVFVGDEAVILCGPSDDPLLVSQADTLAASPQVQFFYRVAGYTGQINSGVISGSHVKWQASESAIVSKLSGQVEAGDDTGPLVAIVLNDQGQALTTSLCVTTATARVLDPDVPELDNGKLLSALAGIHDEELKQVTGITAAFKAKHQAGFVAHEITSDEFLKRAVATPLVNHGRKWEVFVGEQSFGFSDGITAGDAMREAHKREVNNALYSLSKDNTGSVEVKSVPPDRVLNEYPDLVEKFANALDFNPTSKTVINVPFKEKDEAKALGAKWDRQEKSWYIPAGVVLAPFDKWMQKPSQQDSTDNRPLETARFWRHNSIMALKTMHFDETLAASLEQLEKIKENKAELKRLQGKENAVQARYQRLQETRKVNPLQGREYLAVPYSERVAAKAAGAVWDKSAKSWYAGPKADMEKLKIWLPENVKSQQEPAMTPREEFAEALTALGCVVKGKHPVMDGTKQRIQTVGDKSGEKAGFYFAHLDGHPAGFIQNNRTGESLKWKSKGYALSDEEKAKLLADSAIKLQQREVAQAAQHNAVAVSVRSLLAVAPPAPVDHKYLQTKDARPGDLRVVPAAGSALPAAVMIGKNWKESMTLRDSHPDKLVFTAGDLLLAAQDVSGEIRSVQSIQENGMKRFATGGTKQDTFHVVGGAGLKALSAAPAIVIGEGYATADTLSQSLGYATVAAFDSGNLPHVAKQLRDQFPDKPFVIAGDNDLHQELTEGRNPGKEKALAAATAVDGIAVFPIFAPREQAYPANLEPVTPAKARGGDLSEEQKNAIAAMKGFTDFNDLATKSVLGREGVDRQVKPIVDKVVDERDQALKLQQDTQAEERTEKLVQENKNRRGIRV